MLVALAQRRGDLGTRQVLAVQEPDLRGHGGQLVEFLLVLGMGRLVVLDFGLLVRVGLGHDRIPRRWL